MKPGSNKEKIATLINWTLKKTSANIDPTTDWEQ